MIHIKTAESVTEGHPDKICDKISDAILDEHLKQDPYARVAVETLIKGNTIVLAGEITSTATCSYIDIIKHVIQDIGYTKETGFDIDSISIVNLISTQSPEIKASVDILGAGDQGIMYGYACDETKELLPLPVVLVQRIAKALTDARKEGTIKHLAPDGKCQVSIVYENNTPLYASSIIISQQHTKDVNYEKLAQELQEKIIMPICKNVITEETIITINGTKSFIIGGPVADAGVTGRKTAVDTYGGLVKHGGGAFSGKDPTKVDRSAAYYARYIAKHIVVKKFAKECEVQIAYFIGGLTPTAIDIHCFGTEKIPIHEIQEYVKEN
ncbi:MAG: methionine adenosyltransferase, partial [Candidatus Woesearchaeota archaeon]